MGVCSEASTELSFRLSPEFLLNRRRQQLVTLSTVLLLLSSWIVLAQESAIQSLRSSAPLIGLVIVFIFIPRVIAKRLILVGMKNTVLRVGDQGICWDKSDRRDFIRWDSVRKVHVLKTRQDRIYSLEIDTDRKRPITLVGYENFCQLLQAMQQLATDQTRFSQRYIFIDWHNPLTPSILLITALVLLLVLRYFFGDDIVRVFVLGFRYGIALFFLCLHPSARTNPNLIWIDISLGSLLLVRAVLLTIY